MGTFLGLKALHDGIDAVPDSVWHKIPYFCPPEEKEKQRRGSKQRDSRPTSERRRSYSASYAESDSGTRRARKSHGRRRSKAPSDAAAELPDRPPPVVVPSGPAQPHPADINEPDNITYPNAVAFSDPFANKSVPAPLPGYSDGPAPPFPPAQHTQPTQAAHQASPYTPPYPPNSQQYPQLTYRGPRHSIATDSAPMSTPGPNQPYYPPPPRGDDYPRNSYDPSRYQPAGDYARGDARAADEQVGVSRDLIFTSSSESHIFAVPTALNRSNTSCARAELLPSSPHTISPTPTVL